MTRLEEITAPRAKEGRPRRHMVAAPLERAVYVALGQRAKALKVSMRQFIAAAIEDGILQADRILARKNLAEPPEAAAKRTQPSGKDAAAK